MELDSYLKHKIQHIEYLPELTQKPNDLFRAYVFAKENRLGKDRFLQAHSFISEHLPQNQRGVYRRNAMVVMEHNTGRIQFEAAPASMVKEEMEKLWEDVDTLLRQDLSVEEVFSTLPCSIWSLSASHPFNDGNGRAGRLLEKWFLADKLGSVAWYIQSEKHYYQHVNEYYLNLNRLGLFYEELDFSKADRFLMLLPGGVKRVEPVVNKLPYTHNNRNQTTQIVELPMPTLIAEIHLNAAPGVPDSHGN